MDSPIFGGSCCCLQVTMQLQHVDEARKVYDALMPLTPLMVCLNRISFNVAYTHGVPAPCCVDGYDRL